MDFFRNAKTVRLTSYKDRYLTAEEDKEYVTHCEQDKSAQSTIWTVELVQGKDFIRLRSCYNTYLTASSAPILPGVSAKKVLQTEPTFCDPTTQWEPIRDGMQVKLKSFWGNYLRPHGGLPPWRHYITHDVPHLPTTKNKLLWDVEVVEKSPAQQPKHDNKFGRMRSRSYSEKLGFQKQNVITVQECA